MNKHQEAQAQVIIAACQPAADRIEAVVEREFERIQAACESGQTGELSPDQFRARTVIHLSAILRRAVLVVDRRLFNVACEGSVTLLNTHTNAICMVSDAHVAQNLFPGEPNAYPRSDLLSSLRVIHQEDNLAQYRTAYERNKELYDH